MQIFYYTCYAVAAVAVALALRRSFPEIQPLLAWLVAGVGFLSIALVHEITVRRRNERRELRRLARLHRVFKQSEEEMARQGAEIERLRGLLESTRRSQSVHAGASQKKRKSPLVQRSQPRGETVERRVAPSTHVDELAVEAKVLDSMFEPRLPKVEAVRLHADDGRAVPRLSGASESAVRVEPAVKPMVEAEAEAEAEAVGADRLLDLARSALRQERLDLYLEPIVALPQRRRRYFECSVQLRLPNGREISADRCLHTARSAGLAGTVDNMLLFRSVESLRGLRKSSWPAGFFCPLAPSGLADQAFFRDFIAHLKADRDLVLNLVFEIAEGDLREISEDVTENIRRLAKAGFRLCLTRVSDLELDVVRLADQGFRFVKIDTALLLPATLEVSYAIRLRRLKVALDHAGISMIVDKLGSEQVLTELQDFKFGFAQGPLFGSAQKCESLFGSTANTKGSLA
jgi:cyclic-di-GMP phosphodiesterase TipF (flagellum assembly factor)